MGYEVKSLAERARYLRLASIGLAEGMRSGSFRANFRGQGIEFDSVREYERGDDVRAIDWNVTARTGRAFVKTWREERELSVFLIIDNSLSMLTGGSVSRRDVAFETALLIALAAEQMASPVGALLFDGVLQKAIKPRAGKDQILTLIRWLDDAQIPVEGSFLEGALAGASRLLRSKALVVVISDFRIAGYEKPLGILARKHDVLAIRITSPFDTELPRAGYLPFRDPETNQMISVPTNSQVFRNQWATENAQMVARWKTLCIRRGVSPLELSVEDDPVKILQNFFSVGRKQVL